MADRHRPVGRPEADTLVPEGGSTMLRNGLEPWHLLVVAVIVILLFGAKKLPDTARALGKSMRILKSEASAMRAESGGSEKAAYTGSQAAGVRSDAAASTSPLTQPAAAAGDRAGTAEATAATQSNAAEPTQA